MANGIGTFATIRVAATTAANAAIGPTDKSMPPDTMTSVMPSAMHALIDDCCRMLIRFGAVRKTGLNHEKTTTMIVRPNRVPRSRMPIGNLKGFLTD